MSIDYSQFAIPKPTKKKSKKRKNYTDIPKSVKQIVWKRDKSRCIFCHKYVPVECACCHYIPRSAGGLGIEQNIFTACVKCHGEQDNGLNTKLYDKRVENYLKGIYGAGWSIEKLIYNKWRQEKWN